MSAGTRARLSPGEQLRGEGRPLSVTGCLLFKEWDPEDRRHYFWEEWQLSGMDDYDTWVELDHYDGRVHLYEPSSGAVRVLDLLSLRASAGPGPRELGYWPRILAVILPRELRGAEGRATEC